MSRLRITLIIMTRDTSKRRQGGERDREERERGVAILVSKQSNGALC
ncbi:MAG: hypothetical protein MJE68_27860 [Proteobacteria bacterium]|nr:hypothetical protein [Pseudomonadota bacterium]